jgi:GNAT superfamily N-acetyltransferase
MDIRLLPTTDLHELLALYAHLHRADLPLPEPAVVQAVWQELMGNPRYRYFGGYVQNALVASCTLTVIPNLTRGCQPYGVIENVVTHADHRKRGHGKALLAHALAHAWSVGCYKVMLLTGRKDDATFQFYASAGFDPNDKQAFVAKPSQNAPKAL